MQLTETVPPEILFRDYLYFSSYSDTVLENARRVTQLLVRERGLGAGSLVVEVASNDGYLLQFFKDEGVPVLGVEPARNVARVAEERGIPTLCEFFSESVAHEIVAKTGAADVLIANNVLAHVADLNGFVCGIRTALHSAGVAVLEVPYVRDLIERCEFDTIYHEHLCYFSLTALQALFRRHALEIVDVERIPIHGGSLRIFATRGGRPGEGVLALLEEERAWGVAEERPYADFARAVAHVRADIIALVRRLRAEGKSVAGYGAAAKCTVLANYCGLDASLVDFVADRSPHKQGRLVPGVRIPIAPPAELVARAPDHTILFAWNFETEILRQQAEYVKRGGRFIRPIPVPAVVGP